MPQASGSGTSSAPVVPSDVQQNLNGKGKVCLPPSRSPALIVKRKIVGRAIHLQKKVGSGKRRRPWSRAGPSVWPTEIVASGNRGATIVGGGEKTLGTVLLGRVENSNESHLPASAMVRLGNGAGGGETV